ncbi:MAG: 4'-phosphopantetheinyl transferase superfamily protein [bacterium]|nr:4'-phosphopantetheinyl transferase superfamily protein [bacterium]
MLEIFTVDARTLDLTRTDMVCSERREKLARLKNEASKRLSLAAELALIKAVLHFYPSAPLPLRCKRGKHGKPYLCDYPELHINFSHSGNYAVCAAADREVGIDIQQMRRADFRIAERYFTGEECEYIGSSEARFFELWSKKESRVKATGTGITIPLNSFSVLKNGGGFEFIELTPPESGYVMWVCLWNK